MPSQHELTLEPPVVGDVDLPEHPPPSRWTRRRRILRWALLVFAALVLTAAGIAYWALDRYVIDHVEIADVRQYEAQVAAAQAAGTTVATSTATSDATAMSTSSSSAAITPSATSASEPVVTDTSYTSDAVTITISQVVVGSGDDRVTYYVADVVLADASLLRGGFANNQFGTNIVENTSDIAEDNGAVFAINGDYYGFRDSGIVIRNGVLYRDDGARMGLAMFRDGTIEVYDETTTTGQELIDAGVWNTLSFGPALVDAGVIVDGIDDVEIDTNWGNHSIQGNQPRTGIGLIDTNHFVFVAVDGRSEGYSRGVTMTEFAEIFQELGATVAYNLDGGGSTTMYFNGGLVNDPLGTGTERGTSDILYIAETA